MSLAAQRQGLGEKPIKRAFQSWQSGFQRNQRVFVQKVSFDYAARKTRGSAQDDKFLDVTLSRWKGKKQATVSPQIKRNTGLGEAGQDSVVVVDAVGRFGQNGDDELLPTTGINNFRAHTLIIS